VALTIIVPSDHCQRGQEVYEVSAVRPCQHLVVAVRNMEVLIMSLAVLCHLTIRELDRLLVANELYCAT